ncbi:U3 small nucleolar RNA-associated protein 13 [Ceratobasidium sp. 428]|nr:U3 small nucleolar RNA-associated protein 13 [Ceratobasidium sp. 428]
MSKTSFKQAREIGPVFTAGPITYAHDGQTLVGCVHDEARSTSLKTGSTTGHFQTDGSSVTSLAASPNSTHLALFTTSLSLRLYTLPTPTTTPSIKIHPNRHIPRAHDAPVHVCTIDPTSSILASGSADGIVKIHDLRRGHLTHLFRGHGGIVSALRFYYKSGDIAGTWDTMWLVTASADTRVRIFDLSATGTSAPIAVLEGHVSVPRGLGVSHDGRYIISGGRDAVVLIWDTLPDVSIKTKKGKKPAPVLVKTIPVLERVEALNVLEPGDSDGRLRFYTGGQKGVMRVWDAWDAKVLVTFGQAIENDEAESEDSRQILDIMYSPATHTLSSVHADQNILTFGLHTHQRTHQLVGYNDEVIDAVFLSSPSSPSRKHDTHLALATNSSLIRVYPTSDVNMAQNVQDVDETTSPLNANLLAGHSDIVLTLATAPNGWLVSGAKDKEVRIWATGRESDWHCVALCAGHAESVGAVAFGGIDGVGVPKVLVTGSQDRTIKLWDLSELARSLSSTSPTKLKSLTTLKAHDKDINALDVAPNGKLVATGSQDKTAKIFEIPAGNDLAHVGILKGHKRGVWTVRFSPIDRVIATGSGDRTVKLWSLDDWACLKTFEGHTNSILRVNFLSRGTQLLSAGSDGLVKLWSIRSEECITTLDAHEDKVWALAVSADERTIVSGAADSKVVIWTDSTEEEQREKEDERAKGVEMEQNFSNFVVLNDHRNAILLALSMDHPGRLYNLFRTLRATRLSKPLSSIDNTELDTEAAHTITGSASVDTTLATLSGSDLARLLGHIRTWNASARTSVVAQTILHAILRLRTAEDIVAAFTKNDTLETNGLGAELDSQIQLGSKQKNKEPLDLRSLLDGLIPYTERHLSRAERLVQDSFVVDYVLGEMDMGIALAGVDAMEVS